MAIKVRFVQGSIEKSVGSGAQFMITKNGRVSFYFFLNEKDPAVSQKLLSKIFGKKDLQFRDMNFAVRRPPPQEVAAISSSANPSTFGESGTDSNSDLTDMVSMLEAQEKDANAIQERIMAQIQEGNMNAQEYAKAMMEYTTQVAAEQKKAEEERKRRMNRARYDISASPGIHIEFTLYPENDFFGDKNSQDRNRKCELISLPSFDEDIHSGEWFYFLYVGDKNVMDSIAEYEIEPRLNTTKNIWDQEAINWHYLRYYTKESQSNWTYDVSNGNRKKSFKWPDDRTYPHIYSEDVSYSILDYESMLRFENGERVLPIKGGTNVLYDRSLLALPVEDSEYYFCATNDNLTTPVELVFYYFTIEAENTNVDTY